MSEANDDPIETIAHFLLMARGIYPTPQEEAEALLRRLAHEGWRIGRAIIPGYWMNETSGVLRPAVESYLSGGPMRPEHIAAMRAYLRQWITAPGFQGPGIEELRADIDGLISRRAIERWFHRAIEEGIDPL